MTIEKQELSVNEKKEVQNNQEPTVPGKRYVPATDIVETEGELLIYMDMPGVEKDQVNVKLEKNVLVIDGEISSNPYADLKPLYTEYNIGNFTRRFELSNEIDQSKIGAAIDDGVLMLTLPKVPEKQPRMIQVN
jgi:HSP20 family protein